LLHQLSVEGPKSVTGDALRTALPEWIIVSRLLLAILLGGIIGLEREIRNRPAGLRTHILVSMAAASFTLITIEIYHEVGVAPGSAARTDPVRIVDAVTAGVAFIAAGAIIQSQGDVKGLTTGAAIWLAGAIGVACGIGFYLVASLAAIFAVIVLRLVGWAEQKWLGKDFDS
jgi:putative Mg2+ transporter-C (MgtC) family protein